MSLPFPYQENGLTRWEKIYLEQKYAESQNSKQQRINKQQHVTKVYRPLLMPVASVFAKTLRECVNIWRTAVTFHHDIKEKYQYVVWVKYNLFL